MRKQYLRARRSLCHAWLYLLHHPSHRGAFSVPAYDAVQILSRAQFDVGKFYRKSGVTTTHRRHRCQDCQRYRDAHTLEGSAA